MEMENENQMKTGTPEKTSLNLNWKSHIYLLGWILLILAAVFWQTIAATVNIWFDNSDTYIHGMFVIPAVLWMVYDQRKKVLAVSPKVNCFALIPLAIIICGWSFANLAGISVGMQLSFFAAIPVLVLLAFGWQVSSRLSFPLAYLIFAVPAGEFLIRPLMEFTAWFAVSGLEISGIPVFRDGFSFEIPTGTFNVVKACSGIRYLISSIALGCLFAYMSYTQWWRRVLFILLSIAFPIIANGIRAYGIVMISYLSKGKLGSGIDHFIYGWVWFGVVMLLMFWIGSFWKERNIEKDRFKPQGVAASHSNITNSMVAVIGMIVIVTAISSYRVYITAASQKNSDPVAISVSAKGWESMGSESFDQGWQPQFIDNDQDYKAIFKNDNRQVSVFIPYYRTQRDGKELINVVNLPYNEKWSLVQAKNIETETNSNIKNVIEYKVKNGANRALIWQWYVINNSETTRSLKAKILQIGAMISKQDSSGYSIILMTDSSDSVKEARKVLQEFVAGLEVKVDANAEK